MASSQEFVQFVLDQFDPSLGITAKKMFGEYGLFCDGKMFGMICDDRLFVKATEAGEAFIGDVVEAPPYPGAKPIFLIEDCLDDGVWLSDLARLTAEALPATRRKKGRKT